jgi:cold shock CspA family protein
MGGIMATGKVKWYSTEKRYGFIACDDGREVFLHSSSFKGKTPKEGDHVVFDIEVGGKGEKAYNVSITETAPDNDPREVCRACNKKMVPRMVTYRGQPDKSLCPYCGVMHKDFSIPLTPLEKVIIKGFKFIVHIGVGFILLMILTAVLTLVFD